MIPEVLPESTPEIEVILDKIGSEYEMVPVKPEEYCQAGNCFVNVENKVKQNGGKVHYGWAIFKSEFIYEAIRHAVWEDNNGDLIDVTPWDFGFDKIMFASDNDFIYTDQLVDNIRVNGTKNPLVDDFIRISETLEKFYTYGTRIDDSKMILLEPAKTLAAQYEALKMNFLFYLQTGATIKSPCFCGSPKQYNNCHGKDLYSNLKNDLKAVERALGGKSR